MTAWRDSSGGMIGPAHPALRGMDHIWPMATFRYSHQVERCRLLHDVFARPKEVVAETHVMSIIQSLLAVRTVARTTSRAYNITYGYRWFLTLQKGDYDQRSCNLLLYST
ncbi:hypothetical protein SCLCIDRAFT_302992 [Scleroderma citrinum Foug A]|uniref:Uncharacterized protein n=1 Tax=Scleroderma citrinum Foug A TaxID=1036808 RepID=A0A0C2Z0G8_9AGAM|nr:hypothetical protein SCLCIDRAFT_302992 [Scleroderma citrinum Foug A]